VEGRECGVEQTSYNEDLVGTRQKFSKRLKLKIQSLSRIRLAGTRLELVVAAGSHLTRGQEAQNRTPSCPVKGIREGSCNGPRAEGGLSGGELQTQG